jgi:hypothetical protein
MHRRSFLTTAAAAIMNPVAVPTIPGPRDDAWLLDLCVEVVRLRVKADAIEVEQP